MALLTGGEMCRTSGRLVGAGGVLLVAGILTGGVGLLVGGGLGLYFGATTGLLCAMGA